MTTKNEPTVVGVFPNRNDAEAAVDALRQADFDEKDIGFAIRGSDAVAGGAIVDAPLTKDASGAGKGMVAGGLAGGILGALAALTIPGVGPILAGGILASALGFGAAGTAVGGIFGAMMGLGISEEEAKAYEAEFNAGKAILTVHARAREVDARDILARNGAANIHTEPIDPRPSINPVRPR